MRFISQGCNSLGILLLISITCFISPEALRSAFAASGQTGSVPSVSSSISIDPDIVDSEWNHHLAGYILIGAALLVLVSQSLSRLAFLRAIWPFLFIAAGVYLLAWSDKEIWPRGFLSWTWLIRHDAEARQHKIYGILLLVMGLIEYFRWRGKLTVLAKIWAFPLFALIGAGLLLVHDHGGNSGLSPGWDNAQKAARVAGLVRALEQKVGSVSLATSNDGEPTMNMAGAQHHMANMRMSSPAPEKDTAYTPIVSSHTNAEHVGHVMTPAMLHVKAQHLCFTLIGILIALFKFIDDGNFWRKWFVPHFWPSGIFVLGVLLALYTESM